MFGAFGLDTTLYQTTDLAQAALLYPGRVQLYSVRIVSSASQIRYVQWFDTTTVPLPAGSVPQMIMQIAAGGQYDWHCQGTPRLFQIGCFWGWSDSRTTNVLAPPERWLEAQYLVLPPL